MKNLYCIISKSEAKKIADKLIWTKEDRQKYDDVRDDGESNFTSKFYSPSQSFGATDYKDHRKDTVEQLKKLIYPNLISGTHQRIHFYHRDKAYKKILVRGYLGGYTGKFIQEGDEYDEK